MKFLFVIPEYYPHTGGGIATFYGQLLPRLAAQGCRVDVLLGSPHTVGTTDYEQDGVRIRSLRPDLYAGYRARFRRFDIFPTFRDQLAAAWAAWEQASRGAGYDLVECTDWGLGFVPWVAGDCDLPVRVMLHGSAGQIEQHDPAGGNALQGGLLQIVELSVLPHAEALATYSRSNQAFWQDMLETSVEFHYPGLLLPAAVTDADVPAELSSGLVIGRVQYWKGPTVLCDAMRMLDDRRPLITWVGRDMPYQHQHAGMNAFLCEHYPDIWGRAVVRRAALPPSDVRALQAHAGFGLVPSTWDVFNLVCVEFMALGRPVVCSTGAGASGLIVDGENGFLFAAEDPASLRDALVRLAASEAHIAEISRRGRETVAIELNLDRATDDLIARSTALVSGGRGATRPAAWVHAFVAPSDGGDDHRAVLDQIPLRHLLAYNARRGFETMVRQSRPGIGVGR